MKRWILTIVAIIIAVWLSLMNFTAWFGGESFAHAGLAFLYAFGIVILAHILLAVVLIKAIKFRWQYTLLVWSAALILYTPFQLFNERHQRNVTSRVESQLRAGVDSEEFFRLARRMGANGQQEHYVLAIRFNYFEIAKEILMSGFHPRRQYLFFRSDNDTQVAEALVAGGVEAARQRRAELAFFNAVRVDFETMKRHIERGVDVNATDRNGRTALMIVSRISARSASREEHYQMARFLLENGADVNARMNFCGTDAVWTAVDTNSTDIVRLLIEFGADTERKYRHRTNRAVYETLLEFAQREHRNSEIIELLKSISK